MSNARSIVIAAAYLFFDYNCILVCEIYFLIDGDTHQINYFRVLVKGFTLSYTLFKSAITENSRFCINYFDFFTIYQSNQIKISRKIIRCQVYFFKIALRTRLGNHLMEWHRLINFRNLIFYALKL